MHLFIKACWLDRFFSAVSRIFNIRLIYPASLMCIARFNSRDLINLNHLSETESHSILWCFLKQQRACLIVILRQYWALKEFYLNLEVTQILLWALLMYSIASWIHATAITCLSTLDASVLCPLSSTNYLSNSYPHMTPHAYDYL